MFSFAYHNFIWVTRTEIDCDLSKNLSHAIAISDAQIKFNFWTFNFENISWIELYPEEKYHEK